MAEGALLPLSLTAWSEWACDCFPFAVAGAKGPAWQGSPWGPWHTWLALVLSCHVLCDHHRTRVSVACSSLAPSLPPQHHSWSAAPPWSQGATKATA